MRGQDVAPGFEGPFLDRRAAGKALAARLERFADREPIIVGLPRGGVPIAAVVADALHAPLDVVIVRKVGAPSNPEFALGAVGEGDVVVMDPRVLAAAGVSGEEFGRRAGLALDEVVARVRDLRLGTPPLPVDGRTVIVVDDGIATGATADAAIAVMRARGASEVVMAAPVGGPDAVARLRRTADDVVCIDVPPHFSSVGAWYRGFTQVSDAEVLSLLTEGAPAEQHERD